MSAARAQSTGPSQPGPASGPTTQSQQTPKDNFACADSDTSALDIPIHVRQKDCLWLSGGFSNAPGSLVGLSGLTRNLFAVGEVLSVSVELGVRVRKAQFAFTKNSLFGKPIESGFTVYGQRFHYNQAHEASIFAFQWDIPAFDTFTPDSLLNYVAHSYGGAAFARYKPHSHSLFELRYGYDVSDIKALTGSTIEYFNALSFQSTSGPNTLDEMRTSKLTPTFAYSTVDSAANPTRGAAIAVSMGIAGLGGNVNTVEPAIDARYFRSGLKRGHVIAMHIRGRMLTGYGDRVAPPFDRYYMGGEDDVRGFDSWSISPIAYLPSDARINVLNADGTPRTQTVADANGNLTSVNVQMSVPIYRLVAVGGDTKAVTNVEYRIPLGGPFTLAVFSDFGVNRLTFRDQLQLAAARIDTLNGAFPQAAFGNHPIVQPETDRIRMSTGIQLQFQPKRFNVPLRFYVAYNPLTYRGFLQPPPVLNRSLFPNLATFEEAKNLFELPTLLYERRFMFRFSIGRTF